MMFQNVGVKIKTFALVNFWVDVVAAVIGGIAILVDNGFEMILASVLIMVAGCFVAWVVSLFLYGFGELIETNQRISYKLGGDKVMNFTAPSLGGVPKTAPKWFPKAKRNSATPGMMPNAAQTQPAFTSQSPMAHRWRCDGCGNMIDKEICPFCGKMYGKAAVKVESLQRFLRSGTITPEEYNQRIEAIKNE